MLREFHATSTRTRRSLRLGGVGALCVALCVALAGCGVKGPLRLPTPPAPTADTARPATPAEPVDRPPPSTRQP